ncbi:MAG: acetate--CoA ligase [Bdellovibrionota bacterium]
MIVQPPKTFSDNAHYNPESLSALRKNISDNPDSFWEEIGRRLDWIKPWTNTKEVSFKKPVSIKWYLDGKLNACHNALDRHLPKHADRTAIIWEQDDPKNDPVKITYGELHRQVVQMALVMKKRGVKKGDRVTIYMPMIPAAAVAILACARVGAVHSVVFGGFAAQSIAARMEDGESDFVITADEGLRGGKKIPLKQTVDEALNIFKNARHVLVVKHTGGKINWQEGRDLWLHEEVKTVSGDLPCEPMDSEDPLFLLYTSGSTGKPKGVLHTTGGFLAWVNYTFEKVFDYKQNDVFWCTADVGWVTGHSYLVYGPLSNAATTVLFEGVPSYPSNSRFWEVIDRHKVSIFYTAPTALRALMKEGDAPVKKTSRKSLRLLGSVGEPINPEAWNWYYETVGDSRCPIVDTWWQTETGGILISSLPGAIAMKPGSATFPLPGIKTVLLTVEGKVIEGPGEGVLAIADSWPGQMRTVFKDHKRFEETYFSTYPGYYFTGDGCRRDEDGYLWITGRVDDVINISGHRIGTAEVESSFVANPNVAEAAVVAAPHDIKGSALYVYVTLKSGITPTPALKEELKQWVRKDIGAIATPDWIQFAPAVPKTRSGKIMRRILRKIAESDGSVTPSELLKTLGDTSTLADPSVVEDLIANRVRV